MRRFVTSYLAIPWEDEEFGADTIDMTSMREKAEQVGYRLNTLPDEVIFVTAAVDVHKHNLYCSIVGWTADKLPYLLSHEVKRIEMAENPEAGLEYIKRVRATPIVGKDRTLRPVAVGVDSGYMADDVYKWARGNEWILPIKGHRGEIKVPDGMESYIMARKAIDVSHDGHRERVTLRTINTGLIKRELYDLIASGRFVTPIDVDQTFLDQMNSEKLVTRKKPSGKVERFYVKKRSAETEHGVTQNHYLDTVVYNRAVVEVLTAGMDVAAAAVKWYQQGGKRVKRKATYTD
jgi:phage terminase large subunit GpA-like protein